MPRLQTRKTELTYRNAKPTDKDYLICDGDGLSLKVMCSGTKKWVSRFRRNGVQCLRTIGDFRTLSLKEARERSMQLRSCYEVDNGTLNETVTLDTLIEDFVKDNPRDCAKQTLMATRALLRRHYHSAHMSRPIKDLRLQEIHRIARGLCQCGKSETGHRLYRQTRMVVEHAYRTGRIDNHPICSSRGGLPPARGQNRAAILDVTHFRGLVKALWNAPNEQIAINAMRVMALVFARPSEVIRAQWDEFDLDSMVWVIPAVRMKMRRPHRIPITSELEAILKRLKDCHLSPTYVFPSPNNPGKPISHSIVLRTLRHLGYRKEVMCLHGFRASAATLCSKVLRADTEVIKAQLSHRVDNPVYSAYNRDDYFDLRKNLLRRWEELILSEDSYTLGHSE